MVNLFRLTQIAATEFTDIVIATTIIVTNCASCFRMVRTLTFGGQKLATDKSDDNEQV
ncbi:MAG: hypothetical protein SXV54_10140 [Chloroflexota bacterium]|nr:hypothetical protein [Chloroflexota bacterium]